MDKQIAKEYQDSIAHYEQQIVELESEDEWEAAGYTREKLTELKNECFCMR